jgi:hypothetical protein
MRDADRLTRLRVEEDDETLVRLPSLREVVLKNADQLRTEGPEKAIMASRTIGMQTS